MSQNTSSLLDTVAREIGVALERFGVPPEEIERVVRDTLRPGLQRLDLITREEYEHQQTALEETLQRIAALESRVQSLEQQQGTGSPPQDGEANTP